MKGVIKNMTETEIIKILKSYQAVFFFINYETKDRIIWGLKSYEDMNNYRPVRYEIVNKRRELEKPIYNIMHRFIRKNGVKFRTSEDAPSYDYKTGWYYNKDQEIDFEPLDLVTKPDLGHTGLSYLNPKTNEFELVG
tara:strand:- start:128 stop:538 length:411 start_codon:yes stop_codon:yes gene_type:complete